MVRAERTEDIAAVQEDEVVVGHPEYNPRFDFALARKKGLNLHFPVPEETFMVCELEPDALKGIEGTVKYPPEFEDVT